MNDLKSHKTKVGALALTVSLGGGLLASTQLAGAETGASAESGDLASLLEQKLDPVRPTPSKAPPALAAAPSKGAESPFDVAGNLALMGVALAGAIFIAALWVKRARERNFGEALSSNLSVKESVWIGRGQRVLLLAFENHKVLVGVSGGALHNLGVFGEGGEPMSRGNPIERAAAMKDAEHKKTSEFSDFVKGELAGSLTTATGGNRDRRRKMITELNTL